MFVSKHVVFFEKEFLLRDGRSKVRLEEVQDAQTYGFPEIAAGPSKAQALRMLSRICTIPERYGFLINEQNNVLLIAVSSQE